MLKMGIDLCIGIKLNIRDNTIGNDFIICSREPLKYMLVCSIFISQHRPGESIKIEIWFEMALAVYSDQLYRFDVGNLFSFPCTLGDLYQANNS